MSWHYLQGQEEASWEGNFLDGVPSALLNLIPTPVASCSLDRQTDASNHSLSGMTLRRLTGTDGAEVLTWFLGDSPVRTYHRQAKEQDSTAHDLDFGPSLPGSLAKCSPPLSGWRTRQCCLFGGLTEFFGTWPRWGTMRDGELFLLKTPELLTNENESGSWLTPTVQDCKTDGPKAMEAWRDAMAVGKRPATTYQRLRNQVAARSWPTPCANETGENPEKLIERMKKYGRTGSAVHMKLSTKVQMWPTPTCQDAKNNGAPSQMERNTKPLNAEVGGPLNPTWVEWLMGWPLGWTDLKPLATDKFRQWLESHGIFRPADDV